MKTLNLSTGSISVQAGRIGPFFDFSVDRRNLVSTGNYFNNTNGGGNQLAQSYQYMPDNGAGMQSSPTLPSAVPMPYAYFVSRNGGYSFLSQATNPPTPVVSSCLFTFPSASGGTVAQPIAPLVDSRQTTLSGGVYSPVWMNAKTFQILCPGLDGSFGNYFGTSGGSVSLTVGGTTITGVPCGFYPSGVNYPPNTPDDITNFTTGATLQDDMAP